MVRYFLISVLVLLSLTIYAQKNPSVKTGENFITLDGERFHNEKIILTPNAGGADNMWFDNGKQKFTDINLVGKYDGRSVNFQFRFPGKTGAYTIEDNRNPSGSQNNDNNCCLLMTDKDTNGDGLGAETGSVKIVVTLYDKVGGSIEGNINGTLMAGIRNNIPINIAGYFSVIHDKDRKGF